MSAPRLRRGVAARARRAAVWLAPSGAVERTRRRRAERDHAQEATRLAAERSRLLDALASETNARQPVAFDLDLAVTHLVERGLDERMVRDGSIPRESLELVARRLPHHLGEAPALALHVGNFVGLSLAHVTAALRAHHPDALVISVDPGIPHRGVERPDREALALLERFGLARNSLVVTGFSRQKNVREDGLVLRPDAPAAVMSPAEAAEALRADAACTDVLPNLRRLLPARFDVVLLDGNHETEYLRAEVDDAAALLRPGGLLVLDDVRAGLWEDLVALFGELSATGGGFRDVGTDGRVGLLERLAPAEGR